MQSCLAIQLASELGFDISKPLDIQDLIKVEKYLKDYQFIIIDGDIMSEIVYAGDYKEKKVILFYHDNHYDTIKSLPAFFSRQYFCYKCLKPYSVFQNHPCNEVCKKCKTDGCIETSRNVKCDFCMVQCRSNECYLKHREKVCSKISKCILCGNFKIFSHTCNGKW